MKPTLNILQDNLIEQILDEAKRILSQIGMEVRGTAVRQPLLDHGLMADPGNGRILFPPDLVFDDELCGQALAFAGQARF